MLYNHAYLLRETGDRGCQGVQRGFMTSGCWQETVGRNLEAGGSAGCFEGHQLQG